ncbi:E3 ubiquitin protein ligase UPL1-like protein [Tanacetum coccineum]
MTSVAIQRVSVTPLDSLDSFFDSYDTSYTNPSELYSEYPLNYDNQLFNIQNEHSEEPETKTIMDEYTITVQIANRSRFPRARGLVPLRGAGAPGVAMALGAVGAGCCVSCHVEAASTVGTISRVCSVRSRFNCAWRVLAGTIFEEASRATAGHDSSNVDDDRKGSAGLTGKSGQSIAFSPPYLGNATNSSGSISRISVVDSSSRNINLGDPPLLLGTQRLLPFIEAFLFLYDKLQEKRSLLQQDNACATKSKFKQSITSSSQSQTTEGTDMKGRLNVRFQGKEGIDAAGLTREWYQLLSRVAKALFDGQLLDVYFTRSFYKQILGVKVTYHDIEAVEPMIIART